MGTNNFSDEKGYVINHFRSKKINNKYLVTTDHGSWIFLNDEEYGCLKSGSINDELLPLLIDKGFVVTENNIPEITKAYRKKCSFLFKGTSLHIVIPTVRCNQKCVYCHANSKPLEAEGYDMSLETAKKTVDLIFQSPSKSVVIEFQGGEPLLRFDIVKYIISYAKEKNKSCQKSLTFRLVTNLTMMTDEIMEYFVKEEVGLCTSLDGPAIVHDKNRGEYEKVVSWIKKIKKEYAPHNLNAMMLVTKNSLPYHKEIIDEYLKLGFNTVWVKPANQLGYAVKNKEEAVCTADEFLSFWKKSLEYLLSVNKKTVLKEHFTMLLLKKIFQNKEIIFTDLQSPCGAAINQLAYNYDGNVYTCDEGRQYDTFKLGTVNNTYPELLTSRDAFGVVMISMNDPLVCDRCAYKPYCGVCPACNYAETGNALTKFPNRRCDMMKGMFDYIFEKLMTDDEYKKMFLNWAGL